MRDKERCYPITGIFTVVFSLSFVSNICYWCCAFATTVLCIFVSSLASFSLLCGRWTCTLYSSKCARYAMHFYSRHTSHFGQSCESTVSCKVETSSSQQTTNPKRQRQKTKSGGYNMQLQMKQE